MADSNRSLLGAPVDGADIERVHMKEMQKAKEGAQPEEADPESVKRREGVSAEVAALVTGLLGLTGVAVATGLPMWKVIDVRSCQVPSMLTLGLWRECYNTQCLSHRSWLKLPWDLRLAQPLMLLSLALVFSALVVSAVAACSQRTRVWHKALVAAGCLIFAACVATLTAVSCTACDIIWNGNVLPVPYMRGSQLLGQALYVGWASFVLLAISAGILFFHHVPHMCHKEGKTYSTYSSQTTLDSLINKASSTSLSLL